MDQDRLICRVKVLCTGDGVRVRVRVRVRVVSCAVVIATRLLVDCLRTADGDKDKPAAARPVGNGC